MLPAAAAKSGLHRLELESRGQPRALDPLGGDLAIAKKALAEGDTPHLQALQLERGEPLADDQLGAAATDVRDQPAAGLARHGMGNPGIDESRLLHARDDLDRMAECFAGALEKGLFAMCHAQGIGADDAHAIGVHVTQALTESLQTGKRASRHFLVDATVLFDAGGEAYHLAQPVDDDELAVRVARHDQVEAVRPQIDGGEDAGDGAVGGMGLLGRSGRDSGTHAPCRSLGGER